MNDNAKEDEIGGGRKGRKNDNIDRNKVRKISRGLGKINESNNEQNEQG